MKKLTSTCWIYLLVLGIAIQGNAFAQDGMKKITSVEGITEYQLDNGLKVLLFPDQSKPQVTVNITYLVGSRHEAYGETGMAHLLEHLVFKGTPTHEDVAKELKDHGAFYNGTTWYDRTNYFETLTATDENLEWALEMEADRMVNSDIAKKDLDSEMTVVRNEFESGENSPFRVLMQKVIASSYSWHNYGKSTIGARADIENVPIERLQAFYRKYYQPDNAVLLVAGKFDEAKTKGWIKQYFGSIPRPERSLYPTYTREPVQDGERSITLKRVGDIQMVSALYHVPAQSHPDFQAVEVLADILTDEPSGRLYKALVASQMVSSLYGWAEALKEPGYIYLTTEMLKEKSLEEAESTLLSTLDELAENPFTEEEVERAKRGILKQTELSFNDSRGVGMFMSEYIASGDWRLAFLNRDRVEKVSVEDVNRVAKMYLKPTNRTVGRFIPVDAPDRVEIPEAPDVAELLKDYKGRKEIAQGEAFDPTPDNIEARVQREVRSKGPSYVFMPKETRGDAVQANLSFNFGTLDKLKNNYAAASLVGSMLNKGTDKMTRQEIQDEFDKLKANVYMGGSYSGFSVTIQTERDNLVPVIDLVGEIIQNPSFPEEEFKQLIDEQLTYLEEQKSEPMALGRNKLYQIINPYPKEDPRYNSSFEEDVEQIKSVSLEDVKSFYKDFYGGSNAYFSVTGDFDKEAVHAALDRNFKSWKSPSKYKRMDANLYEVEAQNISLETPDKANAAFFAGFTFPMQDNDPDQPALMLANYIFGGGGLSSRLANRIRQKEGLSYGVGASVGFNPFMPKATFSAYAIYAPENVEALEKAFKEELEKALKDGFTEQEVEDAKKGWLQQQQVSRSQDFYLVSVLGSYLRYGRDMFWNKAQEEKVSKLTAEEVSAVFKKYIDPTKITYVKAGDFAKQQAQEANEK